MKHITVPAGSVYTLSEASANLVAGDFFCSLPSDTTGVTVTKATAAAVIAAGGVAGCVKAAFTAGATNVEGFSQGIIVTTRHSLSAGTASDVI
jgi:hypothetical protein